MRSLRDLTQHLTARADDGHAAPCTLSRRNTHFWVCRGIIAQVRFLAYHRIKPRAPPLVRTPVNSFEFQSCDRTPQVGYLTLSLRRTLCVAYAEYPSFTARTTRVSNPVRYPRFRTSASVAAKPAAFAFGVPPGIYAFHRYTGNSAGPYRTQANQYQWHFHR